MPLEERRVLNAAPVIDVTVVAIAYSEGDGAVVIDSAATIVDADAPDLETGSLIVEFTAGGAAENRLGIQSQGNGPGQIDVAGSDVTYEGISIGVMSGGGDGATPLVVTFNANATTAAAEALARSVTYENTSEDPSTAPRSVRFSIIDGNGEGTRATATIQVAAAADAPQILLPGDGLVYTENDGPVVIDPLVEITDPDAPDLETGSLVVQFTSGGQAEDRLAIRNDGAGPGQIGVAGNEVAYGGIVVGTFAGGTDGSTPLVIVFNGNATTEAAQALARNITYESISEDPSAIQRMVRFTIIDGNGEGDFDTTPIDVVGVNDPPIAEDDDATTNEDNAVDIVVLGNDVDVDSLIDPATVEIASGPTHGAVFVDPVTGIVTYTPAANFGGSDSFRYTVRDAEGAVSNEATVSIVVTPIPDAPDIELPGGGLIYTENDGSVPIDPSAAVTDPDAPDLENGQLVVEFTSGGLAEDRLAIQNQGTGSGQIGVVGNQVTYAGVVIGTFVGGADGATPLVVTFNANATTAAAQALARAITYENVSDDPNNVQRVVRFTIVDGNGEGHADATTIDVILVNDPPLTVDDAASSLEDTPVVIDVLANDSDVDSALDPTSVTVTQGPAHGSVVVDPLTGAITYTPSEHFSGSDEFRYTVRDVEGAVSGEAVVRIDVTPVADAPTLNIAAPTVSGFEGTPIPLGISGALVDGDGSETLSFVVAGAPTTATLTNSLGQTFTGAGSYTLAADQIVGLAITLPDDTGNENFVLTVTAIATESANGDTAATSGEINVTIVNANPELANLSATNTIEGTATTLSGTINDLGADAYAVKVDWGDGTIDVFAVAQRGPFQFTHVYADDNPTGTPSDAYAIKVEVIDDDGGMGEGETTVIVENVAPTVSDVSASAVVEGSETTLTFTISDPGPDSFTVVIDWGDGATETFDAVSAGTYSRTHLYVDDNPTGTQQDNVPITIAVTDDDTGQTIHSDFVTVINANPVVVDVAVTPDDFTESTVATVTGKFSDVGIADTHTIVIDWGDGTPLESHALAPGSTTFSFSHLYADDNPSGTAADVNNVVVTIIDDDQGAGSAQRAIIVRNVAPELSGVANTDLLAIFGTVTVTGQTSDIGADTLTVWIDWGDGIVTATDATGGSFSATHRYIGPPDPLNPTQPIPIVVTLVDDDGGAVAQSRTAAVPGIENQFFFFITPTGGGATQIERPQIPLVELRPAALPPSTSSYVDAAPPTDTSAAATEIRIVLRSVAGDDIERDLLVLSADALDDLTTLFGRLPDGHYRIYMQRGTVERLVLDVHLRQGRPFDPTRDNEGSIDRPPMAELETGTVESADAPSQGISPPGDEPGEVNLAAGAPPAVDAEDMESAASGILATASAEPAGAIPALPQESAVDDDETLGTIAVAAATLVAADAVAGSRTQGALAQLGRASKYRSLRYAARLRDLAAPNTAD